MEQFNNIEAVLKRAIQLEVEAMTLYSSAAQTVKDDAVRQRLEEMAAQERGHKAKLEDVLSGNVRWAIRRSKAEPVTDLRLSDHLVGGSLEPNADYQDVLLFAARREKAAHEFYKAMGEMVDDKLTQNLFEMLADEELRHKYVLEKTYEEVVYKDF
ncbi:MAG: ferritin family protein [Anaerolineae bacterium]|jgi:rubrerythrin|nr:ferritin family protein [Anaerolineae bacterium]